MVAEWKAIIPPKLKMVLIIAGFEIALDEAADAIQKDFNDFMSSPDYKTEKRKGYRKVFASDDVLYYVNHGTREHDIPKTASGPLVFQWGGKGSYRAKTAPGRIKSRSGGASGPIVVRKSVRHPGTDARHIDMAIVKEEQPKFTKNTEKLMVASAEKAGIR